MTKITRIYTEPVSKISKTCRSVCTSLRSIIAVVLVSLVHSYSIYMVRFSMTTSGPGQPANPTPQPVVSVVSKGGNPFKGRFGRVSPIDYYDYRGVVNYNSIIKIIHSSYSGIKSIVDWFSDNSYLSFFSGMISDFGFLSFFKHIKLHVWVRSVMSFILGWRLNLELDLAYFVVAPRLVNDLSALVISKVGLLSNDVVGLVDSRLLRVWSFGLLPYFLKFITSSGFNSMGCIKFRNVSTEVSKFSSIGISGFDDVEGISAVTGQCVITNTIPLLDSSVLFGVESSKLLSFMSHLKGSVTLTVVPHVLAERKHTIIMERDSGVLIGGGNANIVHSKVMVSFMPSTFNSCLALLLIMRFKSLLFSNPVLLNQCLMALVSDRLSAMGITDLSLVNYSLSWNVQSDGVASDFFTYVPFSLCHFGRVSNRIIDFRLNDDIVSCLSAILLYVHHFDWVRCCDHSYLASYLTLIGSDSYSLSGGLYNEMDPIFTGRRSEHFIDDLHSYIFIQMYFGYLAPLLPHFLWSLDFVFPVIKVSYEFCFIREFSFGLLFKLFYDISPLTIPSCSTVDLSRFDYSNMPILLSLMRIESLVSDSVILKAYGINDSYLISDLLKSSSHPLFGYLNVVGVSSTGNRKLNPEQRPVAGPTFEDLFHLYCRVPVINLISIAEQYWWDNVDFSSNVVVEQIDVDVSDMMSDYVSNDDVLLDSDGNMSFVNNIVDHQNKSSCDAVDDLGNIDIFINGRYVKLSVSSLDRNQILRKKNVYVTINSTSKITQYNKAVDYANILESERLSLGKDKFSDRVYNTVVFDHYKYLMGEYFFADGHRSPVQSRVVKNLRSALISRMKENTSVSKIKINLTPRNYIVKPVPILMMSKLDYLAEIKRLQDDVNSDVAVGLVMWLDKMYRMIDSDHLTVLRSIPSEYLVLGRTKDDIKRALASQMEKLRNRELTYECVCRLMSAVDNVKIYKVKEVPSIVTVDVAKGVDKYYREVKRLVDIMPRDNFSDNSRSAIDRVNPLVMRDFPVRWFNENNVKWSIYMLTEEGRVDMRARMLSVLSSAIENIFYIPNSYQLFDRIKYCVGSYSRFDLYENIHKFSIMEFNKKLFSLKGQGVDLANRIINVLVTNPLHWPVVLFEIIGSKKIVHSREVVYSVDDSRNLQLDNANHEKINTTIGKNKKWIGDINSEVKELIDKYSKSYNYAGSCKRSIDDSRSVWGNTLVSLFKVTSLRAKWSDESELVNSMLESQLTIVHKLVDMAVSKKLIRILKEERITDVNYSKYWEAVKSEFIEANINNNWEGIPGEEEDIHLVVGPLSRMVGDTIRDVVRRYNDGHGSKIRINRPSDLNMLRSIVKEELSVTISQSMEDYQVVGNIDPYSKLLEKSLVEDVQTNVLPLRLAKLNAASCYSSTEIVTVIHVGSTLFGNTFEYVPIIYVLLTNNQYAKDMFMAELMNIVHRVNIKYGYNNDGGRKIVLSYTNIVTRDDGGVFSDQIRNDELAYYDLPTYSYSYKSERMNAGVKIYPIVDYMKSWESIKTYHHIPVKADTSSFEEYMLSGHELSYYTGQADWPVKAGIWEAIFGSKISSYEDVQNTKIKVDLSTPSNASRSMCILESGRTLGFLHNCISGRQRLRNQIEGMFGAPIAKPSVEMSSEVYSIPKPVENDPHKLMARALMRMPLNSSSGHGAITAGQYITSMTPEEYVRNMELSDRCYSCKIRLDPGAKERFAYARKVDIRFADYMHTYHLYDWMKDQKWCSMHYDLIGLSREFTSWHKKGWNMTSLDFKQFDAHHSLLDLMHVKSITGIKTEIYEKHMAMEGYAYPLLFQGNVILSRADRLMSGDYLTSFYGTMWQRSWVNHISKDVNILAHMSIGDDLVIATEDKKSVDFYAKLADDVQSPISIEKSYEHIHYNRRIWLEDQYPYNNPYTLINTIYRTELQSIDKTIRSLEDRWFEVYCSYVAFSVRMMHIENGYAAVEILERDLYSRVGLNMADIYTKEFSSWYRKVEKVKYPMLEALGKYMEPKESEHWIYELFNVDPVTMISRYVTNPYVDTFNPKWHASNRSVHYTIIDTSMIHKYKMRRLSDVPYWLHAQAESKLGSVVDPVVNTWINVLSKMSLPIIPAGTYKVRNTAGMVSSIVEYITYVFPNTVIHKSNVDWLSSRRKMLF